MTLIVCRECGNQMSNKATACPKCGNPQGRLKEAGRGKDLLLMFGGLLMILLFFSAAIYCSMFQYTFRYYLSMIGGFAGIGLLGWGLVLNHIKHTSK